MPAVNENGYLSLTATAAAIAKNRSVAINSSGLCLVVGTINTSIGTTIEDVAASGNVTIKLWSAPGAHFCTASGAITAGVLVYNDVNGGAVGKITSTSTSNGNAIGVAMEAATADGDIIRVLPVR